MRISRTVVVFAALSLQVTAHAQGGHSAGSHRARSRSVSAPRPLNIINLMRASRSAIERSTGHAIAKSVDQVNEHGLICRYRVRGNEYVVNYIDGKAATIVLTLRSPFASPEAALRAAGISLSGHKPADVSRISRVWRGSLSSSGVRFLAIGRTSEGWNEIEVRDDENR